MDYLKISHQNPAVTNEVVESLSAKDSQVGKMEVRRRKKHGYLGMALDFSEDGKSVVDTEEYLEEILSRLHEDINGMATTPAVDHLLKTRKNAPILNKERAEIFHRVTTQILFVAQCGRPDLRTAISFLTKRVREDATRQR